MFAPVVTVSNPQLYRLYPREYQYWDAQVHGFVQDIQNKAPAVYQKRTLFEIKK